MLTSIQRQDVGFNKFNAATVHSLFTILFQKYTILVDTNAIPGVDRMYSLGYILPRPQLIPDWRSLYTSTLQNSRSTAWQSQLTRMNEYEGNTEQDGITRRQTRCQTRPNTQQSHKTYRTCRWQRHGTERSLIQTRVMRQECRWLETRQRRTTQRHHWFPAQSRKQ